MVMIRLAVLTTCVILGLAAEFSDVVGQEGYFRVAKDSNGVWWFLEPGTNQKMFLRGVTSANAGGLNEGDIGPYFNATTARYGDPIGKPAFRESVWRRLRSWGFNFLGAWATPEFQTDEGNFPYSVDFEASYHLPANLSLGDLSHMPDVWSPLWLSHVDAQADAVAPRNKNNRMMVGYYSDNELGWAAARGQPEHWPPAACLGQQGTAAPQPASKQLNIGTFQYALSLNASYATYSKAWELAVAKHGSVQAAGEAWGLGEHLTSEQLLGQLTTAKGLALCSDKFAEDESDFLLEYSRQYFNATTSAVRQRDSNHLMLGSKFATPRHEAVYRGMIGIVDVVSIDNYRYNMTARLKLAWDVTQLPVLIAEYAWEGSGCPYQVTDPSIPLKCCNFTQFPDYENPAVSGFPCPVPGEPAAANFSWIDRAQCNGAFALVEAVEQPWVVGYVKYRWVDHPAMSGSAMRSLGMVDIWDQAKPQQVSVMSAINAAAEATHAQGQYPLPDGTPAWIKYCPVY